MPPAELAQVVVGRPRHLDEHLTVARVLPVAARRALGPFVFLDHMGPTELAPGDGFDVRPHPHIGLSTVTALFAGEIMHRDSLGVAQVIRPGELNVMVAGRGVVHSERATPAVRERGGPLHGLQLWMALPKSEEECAPSFEHRGADELPVWEEDGARAHLLLGGYGARRSPVQIAGGPTLIDVVLADGASFASPAELAEHGVYVACGEVELAGEVHPVGHLLIAAPGASLTVRARGAARIAVVGGDALDGPRHLDWNFVSSSTERLAAARADWQARRFPTVPGDEVEFVPYP
ncbi:MAG: pirin family protein [Kofleriaceae bacterium]